MIAPLDRAVDRAHDALRAVAEIADGDGATELAHWADAARKDLLDLWESAE